MSPTRMGASVAALLAVVVAAVLVLGSIGPSGPQGAQAASGVNLTGVTCADIYFDHMTVGLAQSPAPKPIGIPPNPAGPQGDLVAKELSRTELSQKNPSGFNNYSVTTVSYPGPDTTGDLVADQPPTTLPCFPKDFVANFIAEQNTMNPLVKFAAVGNKRPSAEATVNLTTKQISFSTCAFSESQKLWVRTDWETNTANRAPKASNFGRVSLYVGTTSPTIPNNPLTCAFTTKTIGFHSQSVVFNREPTTDFNYNLPAPKVLGITDDPSGDAGGIHSALNPVVKFDEEVPDSADTFADDWDGDGCTDWDELDKQFMSPQLGGDTWGRDPFNPNDCGAGDHNYAGSYNVLLTASPATKLGQVDPNLVADVTNAVTTTKGGKVISADITVVAISNGLKNNKKLYWDASNNANDGWWQVEVGSITATTATLNRLFAPPCGLIAPPWVLENDDDLHNVECVGAVQKGNYFHCLSRIDDPKAPAPPATRPLTSNILCYIDSPLLIDKYSAEVPSEDGNAGAPPPLPYTTAAPTQLNGTFNPVTQQIFFRGCFANVGGTNLDVPSAGTAPNIIVESHIDAKSLKGFTDIWFHRTNAECAAKTPNTATPDLQAATTLAPQNIAFNHDGDACTDYDELAKPTPPKPCGDDPYNPLDSDSLLADITENTDANQNMVLGGPCNNNSDDDLDGRIDSLDANDCGGTGSIVVTAARADVCQAGVPAPACTAQPDGTFVAGLFYDCVSAQTQKTPTVMITIHCYTNSPSITINCEDAAKVAKTGPNAVCPNPYNTCQQSPYVPGPLQTPPGGRCGDGAYGGGPRHDPTPLTPNYEGFGDVDSQANGGHTDLTGTITGNTLNFSGCFQNVENALQGPTVYVQGSFDIHTGQGSVTIYTQQTPANCLAGVPTGVGAVATLEFAEHPLNMDHDWDNCATRDELRDTGVNPQLQGGLRDPQNFWDFRSVTTGVTGPQGQGTKDRAVAIGDIISVVSRFAQHDVNATNPINRYSDPKNNTVIPPKGLPKPQSYHPMYDTAGGIIGSAGNWNIRGPDGAIGVGDIVAVVNQFGIQCPSNPLVR